MPGSKVANTRVRAVPLRPERVRVTVRGPANRAEADDLRRALVRDLAALAVDLLSEGRLP